MMKEQLVQQAQKLYFQVMIVYEDCEANADIPEDERTLESAAIDGFEKADEIANHAIEQIHTKFPETSIVKLDLDQAPDGYHLLVVDDTGGKVAKVGVSYTDYTEETIH